MSTSTPPEHDRLSEALAALPRLSAGEGFSGDVLAAWQRRQKRRRGAKRLALSLLLVAGATVLLVARQDRLTRPALRQQVPVTTTGVEATRDVGALLREHRSLQRELNDLRAMSRRPLPLIYLGGDGEIDVVVDPTVLLEPTAQPASYRY